MAQSQVQYKTWQQTQLEYYSYLWGIGLAVTAVLTVIPNFMVMLAVFKDPHRNLRCYPSNLLIASQALADLFVGAIQEPLCIWWFVTFHNGAIRVIEIVSSVFMVSSILHVLVLSYDRYVAVVTPLQYTSRMTIHRTYISSALIWGYSVVYTAYRSILREFYNKQHIVAIVTGLNTVFPAFLGLVLYVCLFHVIRKYKQSSHNLDASGRATIQAYQRQRKMTIVLVAAFLLFLFCLTPWFVFYQVIDACPDCEHNKDLEMYLFCAFYYLFMFKSLLNPFLYAWRLSKFRKAIQQITRCCCVEQRVSTGSSSTSQHRGRPTFRRSVKVGPQDNNAPSVILPSGTG